MSRVLNLSGQIARDDTHVAPLGAHTSTANDKHFEQIHSLPYLAFADDIAKLRQSGLIGQRIFV